MRDRTWARPGNGINGAPLGAHIPSLPGSAQPEGLPLSPKGSGAAERSEARHEFCTHRLQAVPRVTQKLRTGAESEGFGDEHH